jgi:hypothetical protein
MMGRRTVFYMLLCLVHTFKGSSRESSREEKKGEKT